MARISFRSFWSFIQLRARRGAGRRGAARPWRFARRLPLRLERLEDITLPSVSFTPDAANPGKYVVRFTDDVGANDDLRLVLGANGELQYDWNAAGPSSDLDPTTPGV